MTDMIYVTGSGGGSGATSVAFYTAAALAQKGERTLFVDGDCECGIALTLAGLDGINLYTLGDAKSGACRTRQVLVNHPLYPNLYILPTLGCADGGYAAECVTALGELFDRVLCDGVCQSVCQRAILVCETYRLYIKRSVRSAEKLRDGSFKKVGVIANKVNGAMIRDGVILTPSDLAEYLKCELMGTVPHDFGMPLGKLKGNTKKAIRMCADRICGDGKRIYKASAEYAGFKGAIKRRLSHIL